MSDGIWSAYADTHGAYQFTMYGPARFYLTERRFGLRRWLLSGIVGTAYRHKFYRSEEAAKCGAEEWAGK